MMKLYMISVGGKAAGANIEVHDVQFVVAENIDGAIPLIKDHWYGTELKLHMDSYMEIKGADGYALTLTDKKQSEENKLFFAYLGGYNEASTQEVHDVRLMVSGSEKEAKSLAMKSEGFDYTQRHIDSVVDVESKLLMTGGNHYYLKLTPTKKIYHLKPEWFGYRRLDQK